MNTEIEITPRIQRFANIIARRQGYGKATKIKFVDQLICPLISERIHPGYRKKSNGEYVGIAYLTVCRGKGVYYQNAVTEVSIPTELLRDLT